MLKFNLSAAFALYLCGVFGQDKLSLSDAIQLGLERNYDIRLEQKNVEQSVNNNDWGEAGRYPTITLRVNQNNSIIDNVKTTTPFQLQDQILSNSVNPSINLDWTIFDGFRANISKRRLGELQSQAQGNANIVIANTIQSVILGYYRVVLEKERLDEFKKQLVLSSDRYEYVQIKADLGSAISSDLLLEEGNYLTDSVDYVNQELTYRNALRDLNFLLDEENTDKEYILTDKLEVDEQVYELEPLLNKIDKKNVDLKQQYITQKIFNYDLKLAKASRYPSLDFNAGFSDDRSRVDLSNASFPNAEGGFDPGPPDPLSAITDTYFANFTLSFTLFDGGRINRAIRNAVISEDIENIRTERLKTSLYRDLGQAYDQYRIRLQLYGINERRKDAAATNLSISEEKYKNGTINSFDYRTVQNNYLTASIQELQSLYDLVDSKVTLMRLTGGIIETYVEN